VKVGIEENAEFAPLANDAPSSVTSKP